MNAHKDTQHPAGQVVNQDEGQRTLSDYIRSIKRVEALDDITQDKKLTFEEWYHQRYTGVIDETYLEGDREIWDAALKHGKM